MEDKVSRESPRGNTERALWVRGHVRVHMEGIVGKGSSKGLHGRYSG